MMKCGQFATVIRYAGARDIDIRFDNGSVAAHREYRNFVKGTIQPT